MRRKSVLPFLITYRSSLITLFQVFDDELQTRAAVPAVRLHRVGQFDALAWAGRCCIALRSAPPDALVYAPFRSVDVELQMLLLHDARRADDAQATRDEDRTRPTRAVRLQSLKRVAKLKIQSLRRKLRIVFE